MFSMAIVSCGTTGPSTSGEKQTTQRNRLYGVDEPITIVFGNRASVMGDTNIQKWKLLS